MFAYNLLIFVQSVSSFPYINEAVLDPQAKVVCDKKGVPTSIRFKRKGFSRWIVAISTWGLDDTIGPEDSLKRLRMVFTYVNVGCFSTPGSMGHAVLTDTWAKNRLPRHTTANGFCNRFLQSHLVGGRVDTPGLGKKYPSTLEYDMKLGYLSEFIRNPTGTSVPFHCRNNTRLLDMFETWFAECQIYIREPLDLGPFPVRERESIKYPTQPGEYTAYLWEHQAALCIQDGCSVQPIKGYGWYELTDDTTYFCYAMYDLHKNAPPEIKDIIKRSIVATIGRNGMQSTFYKLVPEYEYQEGDTPLIQNKEAYNWFIREYIDFNSANMLHWYSYNLTKVACDTYDLASIYARSGQLVCTNYDSVMIHSPTEQDYRWCISRDNPDASMLPPGSWRWEELHNVEIVAPRSVISDEKITLPGVPKDGR